ncbi:hypothetical protein [Sphingomonas sp. CARO-RG-8B-R24-01]|uniref:hypothetical protein n=1 Tax=Sphingomonas sp. CARO-RG-8B-R24-01 TaxID=2914831 RepID=UPI001F572E4B|nr:hypothetical protein [Sphingomonas sp. CARO-RG-8B-R24-01]
MSLVTACASKPSVERQLSQCKVSAEPLYAARPTDEAAMEGHLANCMRAAGYIFVEAKTAQVAHSVSEKVCFADWDGAHFRPECYLPQ